MRGKSNDYQPCATVRGCFDGRQSAHFASVSALNKYNAFCRHAKRLDRVVEGFRSERTLSATGTREVTPSHEDAEPDALQIRRSQIRGLLFSSTAARIWTQL